jgi:aminocarboxymuconate-semialdehyde decarboxylase
MRVVDTHSHFWPSAILEFIRAGGDPSLRIEEGEGEFGWLVHERGLRYRLAPAFHDLDAKLAWMDAEGIDVSLHSIPAPFFFYELPAPETLRLSRIFNEAIAEQAAGSAGRIGGIATVPLNDPELAAGELHRARTELGLCGVQIGTSLGSTMLDAPELDPFFAAAAELRMPVQVHPYLSMLGEALPPGLDRFLLSITVANPLETATAAARLILGGVFDRHPELRIQLVHGGGFLPYQLGRLQRGYERNPLAREGARRSPLAYLDNLLIDTILYEPRAIEFLISLVGPERVVFGTDAPFDLADLAPLRMIEALGEGTAELVLGANAERAYSL